MARRGDADPLLLQAVSERLARLLAESPPESETGEPTVRAVRPAAATTAATPEPTELDLGDLDEVPPPRRFGRLHVGVVCLLLLVGLAWAGWTVLRARPVALAAPVTVSALPSASAGGGAANGPVPTGSAASSAAAQPPPVATPPATKGVSVVVHILGAVRRPGLVSLTQPARVQDAVDAAGGLRGDADPGELNLAQLLVDGQQVVIGTERKPDGEVRGNTGAATPGPGGAGGAGGAGTGARGSGSAAGGTVDLNTATPAQLEELPGIGPVTAAAIVAWRTEHSRFSRPEELQEVDGIGPKTYAQLAPHVRV